MAIGDVTKIGPTEITDPIITEIYEQIGNIVASGGFGAAPVSGSNFVFNRTVATATQGQTVFPVVHTVGFIQVYADGMMVPASDYIALGNGEVTFNNGLPAGTIVEFFVYTPGTSLNQINPYRKNYIINGNFDIWQRGTSQTSSSYGSDDRWGNNNIGSTKTHSQQAFTLGQTDVPSEPKYFSRTIVTSVAGSENYCVKFQYIESVRTLAGKTATLSFYAKADASKNMTVEFSQYFGPGGSAPIDGIGVTTCTLTTAWQKFTVTVNIPSINGKTIGSNDYLSVFLWFDAGSDFNSRLNSLGQQSGTFDIAQVQLEEGSVATNFEYRPIGEELALCQRYYESFTLGAVVGRTGTGGANAHVSIPTSTTKRVLSPAVIVNATYFANGTEVSAGTPSYSINDKYMFIIGMNTANTGTYNSNELILIGLCALDAEL